MSVKPTEKEEVAVVDSIPEPVPDQGAGITLNPPIEFDGRLVSFISTDFNRLKGGDLRQIAKEYKALYRPEPGASYFMDTNYLLLVFAKINNVDPIFFDKIGGASYLAITEFYKIGIQESLSGN